MSVKTLTLFAGAGGADLGLRAAGCLHLACVEGDPIACATLRAAGFPAVHAWIGSSSPDGQPVFVWEGGAVDLLWASPPCQPYSRAGKQLGSADSRDGWPATLAALEQIRPTWAIVENVRGVPIEQWERQLQALGYVTSAALLNAADWGLPSHRTRWYLVAGPTGYSWPSPTHYGPKVPWLLRGNRKPWVGFGEALCLQRQSKQKIAVAVPADIDGWSVVAGASFIGDLIYDNGDSLDIQTPDGSVEPIPTEWCKVLAIEPDKLLSPSTAVSVTDVKGTNYRASGGPQSPMRSSDTLFLATGRRRLTWQECATLVGFPSDYPFQGGSEAKYRQIGNAVAPVMARVLAERLQ